MRSIGYHRLFVPALWLAVGGASAAFAPEPMYRAGDRAIQAVEIPSRTRDGVQLPDADALADAIEDLTAMRRSAAEDFRWTVAPQAPASPLDEPAAGSTRTTRRSVRVETTDSSVEITVEVTAIELVPGSAPVPAPRPPRAPAASPPGRPTFNAEG
jgi:hypothetical protein